MERDNIARLQGSPKAGFDRAVGWMKDPDGSLRRKAAAVFADIGDGPSKEEFSRLVAKDADSSDRRIGAPRQSLESAQTPITVKE